MFSYISCKLFHKDSFNDSLLLSDTCDTGEMVSCSAGANFAPHIIIVAAGEVLICLTYN